MLILTRRDSERVYLGNDVVLTIVRIGVDKVRIGIEAPSDVRVLRKELILPQDQPANLTVYPESQGHRNQDTIDGDLDRRDYPNSRVA